MSANNKISVFVNGQARQLDGATTVLQLVESYGFKAKSVLVEYNSNALPRDEWPSKVIEHGARMEIIRMVAGG